ncbi:hypothetical protein N0V88_007062 [Collariella sp. IMI 366227]|nr:hypothetical protein N0V88_007062 [Collariella sp. IMI 366227]
MSATTTTAVASAVTPSRTANPNAPLSGVGGSIGGDPGLIAIVWVFFATATLFVGLRLSVRFRQHRSFLVDDYFIMFAWVCLLTMEILQMVQRPALWYFTYMRAGRVLPGAQSVYWQGQLKRWQFPIIKLFYTVLWSVKGSFLALFYRFVKPFTWLRRAWYCVATFVVLAYIGCFLQSALACNPPADYFVPGKCNSAKDDWMQRFGMKLSTSLDISTDLMIMILPLSILPSLQLDLGRKIGLAAAFCLGFTVIAVSAVRMTQVTAVKASAIDIVGLAVWGAIESCTAVIVGSLLPLKAVLSRRVQKYGSSGRKNNHRGGQYPYPSGDGVRSAQNGGVSSGGRDVFGPNGVSRTIMVGGQIPLDDIKHSQENGGIYVHKTYETTFDESSSRDDDEVNIVRKERRGADSV